MLKIVESMNRRAVRALLAPQRVRDAATETRVATIVGDVRAGGDAAVRRYAKALDGLDGPFEIGTDEMRAAARTVDASVRRALREAARNIRIVARRQVPRGWRVNVTAGVSVEQKVVPTGPWFQAMRTGTFDVMVEANCQSVVNPALDTGKYLPQSVYQENYGGYEDPKSVELYEKMLRETDPKLQRVAMRAYEKHTLDTMAHAIVMPYWYRIIPMRSYVKGWKISPSHYLNQDLANIWLDNQ